ncbi:unnamed protein product, partial [Adineta ricciae]
NGIDGKTLLSEGLGEAEQKELIPHMKDRITFKEALQKLKNSLASDQAAVLSSTDEPPTAQ